MADNKTYDEVCRHYKELGYIEVPGYYDMINSKGKNRCKICDWENNDTAQFCRDCYIRYAHDADSGRKIHKYPVHRMGREDYAIFLAIAKQIENGETPYVGMDEFAGILKNRQRERVNKARARCEGNQRFNSILYGKKSK